MATVSGNVITSGLRGKIGELLVFRLLRGKTVVSHAAPKPDKSKETVAQRATRTMFREASQWAKVTLTDPEKRQQYQQRARAERLPNAYTAAVKEYMCRKRNAVQEEVVLLPVTKPAFQPETNLSSAAAKASMMPGLHALSIDWQALFQVLFKKNVSEIGEAGTRTQKLAKFRFPLSQSRVRFSDRAASVIRHPERGQVTYNRVESG